MKANDYLGIGVADQLTLDIAQEPEYCGLCDDFHLLLVKCRANTLRPLKINPQKLKPLDRAMIKVGIRFGLLDFNDL